MTYYSNQNKVTIINNRWILEGVILNLHVYCVIIDNIHMKYIQYSYSWKMIINDLFWSKHKQKENIFIAHKI